MRKTVINAGTLTIAGSGKRKEKGRGGWPWKITRCSSGPVRAGCSRPANTGGAS